MTEYLQHYNCLGVRAGCAWVELTKAYRQQVQIWHPDRFSEEDPIRAIAEERIREINQSFRALADFRRQHGFLPYGQDDGERVEARGSADQQRDGGSGRRLNFVWFTLIGVGFAVLFTSGISVLQQTDDPSPSHSPPPPFDPRSRIIRADRHADYFTVGSTLGEVYTVQGVPSKTEVGVWFYGNSRVFFKDGRVIGWDESANHRLKIPLGEVSERHAGMERHDPIGAELRAARDAALEESRKAWSFQTTK